MPSEHSTLPPEAVRELVDAVKRAQREVQAATSCLEAAADNLAAALRQTGVGPASGTNAGADEDRNGKAKPAPDFGPFAELLEKFGAGNIEDLIATFTKMAGDRDSRRTGDGD